MSFMPVMYVRQFQLPVLEIGVGSQKCPDIIIVQETGQVLVLRIFLVVHVLSI